MRILVDLALYGVILYTTNLWFKRLPRVQVPTMLDMHNCLLHVDELHCGLVRDKLFD
jgi:hypothetical protein